MLCRSCGADIPDEENICPECGQETAPSNDINMEEWDDPENYLSDDDLESRLGMNMPKILLGAATALSLGLFVFSVLIYVKGTEWKKEGKKQETVSIWETAVSEEAYREKYLGQEQEIPVFDDGREPIVLEERQEVIERMVKNGNDAQPAKNLPTMPPEPTEEPEEGTEEEPDPETPFDKKQYILPESNSRYLTVEDLKGLTAKELSYARNEIFARHGRKFNNAGLQEYFNSKSWYKGKYSPEEYSSLGDILNDYERKNLKLISQVEGG